eukprot:UN24743
MRVGFRVCEHQPTTSPTTTPTRSPTTSPTTGPLVSPTTSPKNSELVAIPTTTPTTMPTPVPSTSPTTSPTTVPTPYVCVEDAYEVNPNALGRTFSTSGVTGLDQGVLDGNTPWEPLDGDWYPWMKIDLGDEKIIIGVTTQGSPFDDDWVTTFDVEVLIDGVWTPVDSTFTGNTDGDTPVDNPFSEPVSSRYIRIFALSSNNDIALRVSVDVCEHQPTTSPTTTPTREPTTSPTSMPTTTPSTLPTPTPTTSPTTGPTLTPSTSPTTSPTLTTLAPGVPIFYECECGPDCVPNNGNCNCDCFEDNNNNGDCYDLTTSLETIVCSAIGNKCFTPDGEKCFVHSPTKSPTTSSPSKSPTTSYPSKHPTPIYNPLFINCPCGDVCVSIAGSCDHCHCFETAPNQCKGLIHSKGIIECNIA